MFFLNERISRGILTNSKAGIAQLVERNLAKVEVASSNLVSRSNSILVLIKITLLVIMLKKLLIGFLLVFIGGFLGFNS